MHQLALALKFCEAGFLAILPLDVARDAGAITRVDCELVMETPVYAAYSAVGEINPAVHDVLTYHLTEAPQPTGEP